MWSITTIYQLIRHYHELCSKGIDYWYKNQRSLIKKRIACLSYGGRNACFQDLVKKELLEKCLSGGIQNPNQSINCVILNHHEV